MAYAIPLYLSSGAPILVAMRYAELHDRGLLALSGADAVLFLQGLITADATKLADGKAAYAALLSPQGKFLHDFFLIPAEGKIFLDTEKSRLDELAKRLNLYKLRSRVNIEQVSEKVVLAAWGGGPLTYPLSGDAVHVYEDPRFQALGWRIVGGKAPSARWCEDREGWEFTHGDDYDRMRLSLGVPEGGRDMIPEKSFLLEWGFEGLSGVDFKKGCYVGQEVTARTKYRGELKKYIHAVRAEAGGLPPPGTEILADGAVAGELRSSRDGQGIALIRLEHRGKALTANGAKIEARVPKWAAPFLH